MKKKEGFADMLTEANRIINKYHNRQMRKRRARLSFPLCLLFLGLALLLFIFKF